MARKFRRRNPRLRLFHSAQLDIYKSIMANPGQRDVLRCGRRFGKTTMLEDIASKWAYEGKKVGWFSPSYKLILPTYRRIHETLMPVKARASKTEGMIETKAQGQVEFWTLDNEDAGRSRSYDLAIIDEGSLVKKGLKDTWEQAIAPTLLDRRGRAIMAGTPKGIDPENFFYECCHDKTKGWEEHHAPTRLNPTLDPEGVANLINEHPPLVYQQEFLAEFVDWRGNAFFSEPSLLVDGEGIADPIHCDYVFATIDTAVKTGKENDGTAVCYWARNRWAGQPLILLDWDIIQIDGDLLESWLPSVFERLEGFAKRFNARRGSGGAHIEDKASGMILLMAAQRRGWPAHGIPSVLTSVGKDERAIAVSGYVFQGQVKMIAEAHNKTMNYKGQMANHFLNQVCQFHIGVKNQADDLLDAFTYGVAIALGDGEGF